MKKYFVLLILLLNCGLNAQNLKFALLSDPLAARINRALPPDSIKLALEKFGAGELLFASGNLTGKGTIAEFSAAKSFLDSISAKYNVLCGKNDFLLNYTSAINIRKFFTNDNFTSPQGEYLFLGIQSVSLADNEFSHIAKETFDWLKGKSANLKGKKIILLLNSTPEKIDNFALLADMLKEDQVNLIFTSEFQLKKKKETPVRRGKIEKKPAVIPYFYAFEISNDSLFIYSYSAEDKFALADTRTLGKIDLSTLNKSTSGEEKTKSLISTNSTAYSKILPYKDSFIIGSLDGKITSFNSDFTVKWQHQLTGSIVSTPVIAEGNLIAASINGDIVILNPDTKAEVQTIGIDCEIVTPLTVIDFKGTKELLIPKSTTSQKALVFGGVDGEIYCYDLETLQELWVNSDSKSPIVQNVIDIGNKLIFKNGEGYIICIDSKTGHLIWKWNFNDIFADTKTKLYSTGKQIITLSNKKTIIGIDLLLGVAEWESEREDLSGIFIPQNETGIIYSLTQKKIVSFDSRKGQYKNEIKLKEKNINSFLPTDQPSGNYYLLSDANILYKGNKLKSPEEIGFAGNVPVVSFTETEEGYYLLNSDGQLFKLNLR